MVVLHFKVVYIVLVVLQYGNETATQEINVQNNTTSYADEQQEARAIPRSNNNIFEYFGNQQKEYASLRRKRQTVIPNLLGLGTKLLPPPKTNVQLSPGVSAQLNPGINVPLNPGINAQLNPGINSPLCPGIITKLSQGINIPLSSKRNDQMNPGIKAQLSPEMNAQLSPGNDKEIPNIKEQSSVSGTINSVKHPVQVFFIYPKDIDKNFDDIKAEQTPFIEDNRNISNIIDAMSPDNLEKNNIVKSTATKSVPNMIALNLADKSYPIINNTAQIATNQNSNVIDPNHIESLSINKTNKIDKSSTDHTDEDYLKHDTHSSINNVAEEQLLHTSTESENCKRENSSVPSIANYEPDNFTVNLKKNNSSGSLTSSVHDRNNNTANDKVTFPDETDKNQHESRPIPSAPEANKEIRLHKFEMKPIHKSTKYILMEKVKPDIQISNATKYEKTDHGLENSAAHSDEENTGQLYNKNGNNNISNNASEVKGPCLSNFPYFYHQATPENWGAYSNYLNHIYNHNRNAFVQRYGNMRPAFQYPFRDQNMLTYQYQKTEGTPRSIEQIRKPMFIYNENRNNGTQEYSNILPVFKYPIEMSQHYKSQTIPENYNSYNRNVLYNGYNQKGNYVQQDYSNIPSECNYPLDTNNWYYVNQRYANRPGYKYQNVYQYIKPDNLAEIYRTEGNRNDIKESDINRNNDSSIVSRKFEPSNNNNNSYGMVNLNTGITAQAKRIPCRCNQQSSHISCNGFYENRSGPITYPTYFYYPNVYRNIPT